MLPEKRLLSRREFLSVLPMIVIGTVSDKIKQILNDSQNSPKFKIGDCIEVHGQDVEGSRFWERGIVTGILGSDWHWNTTKDEWLYYYKIEDTSYSSDFKGATGEAFEDELTLVSL